MKKIIAIILCAASLVLLCACGAKPDFYELDSAKVNGVNFVLAPDAQIDKKEFIEAYNKAEVNGKADSEDVSTEVIVVTTTNDTAITVYYLEDDKFAVSGSDIKESYIISAPQLSEYYNEIAHPQAEFVKFEADKWNVVSTAKPDAEIDGAPFIKAYNEAKFIGNADGAKSSETLVFVCNDGEYTFVMSYYEDNKFIIEGSKIDIPFIVESKRLSELYKEAVK